MSCARGSCFISSLTNLIGYFCHRQLTRRLTKTLLHMQHFKTSKEKSTAQTSSNSLSLSFLSLHNMAESFLFEIAANILMKIGSLAYQELSLSWGLDNDLRKLEETLSIIKAVLLDAEQQQVQNHELCIWLGKLKDIFYDADDVLDEDECEALRRLTVKKASKGIREISKRKVKTFFSSYNPIAFRFKIGHKIKEIRERIDEMAAEKSKFHLTERVAVDFRCVFPRERVMTHSFVHASDVIGRDSDKKNIVKFLLHPCDAGNISLVPIVGIGGLGKTTLARMVYNDERVNRHFALKMWVCVSEDFDVTRLMKEIIDSATGEYCAKLTADQLQIRLRDTLDGKKFLLILDDVWNENRVKWIELRELLRGGAKGSKIVVTTRSNQVASIMGTIPPYVLRGLAHEDCLSLFLKWAFVDGEEKKYSNLVKIGDEIVKKCGGVPLAVRSLGSLLYTKTDENDWLFIKDNDIWRLEQRGNDILPALKLSYDHLPSHLQRCFAYCSLFPKDYRFDSRYLVYYWMALGLLFIPKENEELEDVGLRYLKELLSRCFFQDVEDYGFYFTFKMHDLIHDLAVLVAQRECLMANFKTQNVDRKIRHISLIDAHFESQEVPNFLNTTRSLRTVFFLRENDFFTESFLNRCLSRFKFLRLLSLSSILGDVLPESVGTLKHLRYLDLSHNFFLAELPESICQLQNLQTLRLVGCSMLYGLPYNMELMISLRYLEITTCVRHLPENGIGFLNSLRYLYMDNCFNLVSLFQEMQSLTALRTIYIRDCACLTSLPCSMKHLTRLEKLVIWDCPKLNLEMELQEEDPCLSLQTFMIIDLPALVDLPQLILQGSASTLQYIRIEKCPSLKALPEWLRNLTSLQKLEIISCPGLLSLPEGMQYLTALRELKIQDSPALSKSCRQDCLKTAHVSEIHFDQMNISTHVSEIHLTK